MLLWVWIAVVVVALIVLVVAAAPLARRLGGLNRAARRLRLRQEDALKLQTKAAVLERTVAEVQAKIAAISPGSDRK